MKKIEIIETKNTIVESTRLTNAIFDADLTKKQLDIILGIISLVNREDINFQTYEIPVVVIGNLLCPSNPRTTEVKDCIRKSLKSIMKSCFCIMNEDRETYYNWVEKCDIDWKQGVIYFKLSDSVKEFYLELGKHNLTYTLENILALRTLTDARLYQWAYGKKGFINEVFISIEDAKLLFCGKEELETYDFLTKYLDQSIKRINEKTDLTLSYEKVRKSGVNKNKISSLKFTIECNYKVSKSRTKAQVKYDKEKNIALWQERNNLKEELEKVNEEKNTLKLENKKLQKVCKEKQKDINAIKNTVNQFSE